jgi:hypothetical protein
LFKNISKKEETVLKKAFGIWGIFDLYEKLNIVTKPSGDKHLAISEGKPGAEFLKKNNPPQIEKKKTAKKKRGQRKWRKS